ncbi:MAG: hypothetical protein ABIA02_01945 [Candidatus Falkowbacteria bacterium]
MILYINTTQGNDIEITIKKGDKIIATKKFSAKYRQAEKLLPEIDKLLSAQGGSALGGKNKLDEIKKIEVENKGDENTSFTALRIGVVTANALGYALGVPVNADKVKDFSIVKPVYNKEPNIT